MSNKTVCFYLKKTCIWPLKTNTDMSNKTCIYLENLYMAPKN